MFRHDIPEGAEESELPRLGYGRVRSSWRLSEQYITVALFGWRLFIARGRYAIVGNMIWPKRNRKRWMFRWWFKRRRSAMPESEAPWAPSLQKPRAVLRMGSGPATDYFDLSPEDTQSHTRFTWGNERGLQ